MKSFGKFSKNFENDFRKFENRLRNFSKNFQDTSDRYIMSKTFERIHSSPGNFGFDISRNTKQCIPLKIM